MNLDSLSKEQKQTLEAWYPRWQHNEITAVEFMQRLDLKKNTFYTIMKEYEAV